MRVISRTFLAFFTAVAAIGLIAGGGCTKRGHVTPSPTPPTAQTYYVNPSTGSDSTGNGSVSKPWKTLTHAVKVLPSNEPFDDQITLAPGNYTAANGETFPIAIPTGVTISGSGYGNGVRGGVYIDGLGEDTGYETMANLPKASVYSTVDVTSLASGVNVNDVYIGAATVKISKAATFISTIALGNLSASAVTFAAVPSNQPANGDGVLVPSGVFTCANCYIGGQLYGLAARSIPMASAAPQVTLSGDAGQAVIASSGTAILTDGTASLEVSGETFLSPQYAYSDTLASSSTASITPGIVDLGSSNANCGSGSAGGNTMVGATPSEINITVAGAKVCAYNDVLNASVQGTTKYGRWPQDKPPRNFLPGAHCPSTIRHCNVVVAASASGAEVTVGPYVAPTSSPSATPTPTPTGSASASSSPSP